MNSQHSTADSEGMNIRGVEGGGVDLGLDVGMDLDDEDYPYYSHRSGKSNGSRGGSRGSRRSNNEGGNYGSNDIDDYLDTPHHHTDVKDLAKPHSKDHNNSTSHNNSHADHDKHAKDDTKVAIHGLPPNRKFRTGTSKTVFPGGFAIPRDDKYHVEGGRLSHQVRKST
jgi:hypothetical protein